MKIYPGIIATACGAALLMATATMAQPVPAPAVGEMVYGPSGADIGKIATAVGGDLVVDTGTHKVAIPPASFARNAKGLMLSATKDQVDAFGQQAEDAAKAALAAALVPTAIVKGANGNPVGTIKSVEAGLVELTTPKGAVKLPITAFIVEKGMLKIGMTQEEFETAVTAAVKPG